MKEVVIEKNGKENILFSAISYVFGSFFVQGLNLITLPIFTRLLNPENYIKYTLFNFWSGITLIFVGLQSQSSVTNAFIDFGDSKISKYSSTLSLIAHFNIVILLFVVFVFRKFLITFLEIDLVSIFLGLIYSYFMFFFNIEQITLRMSNKPKKYLRNAILNSFFTVCCSIIIVLLLNDNKYLGRVYAAVLIAIIFGGSSLIKIYKKNKIEFEKKYLFYSLKITLPLIFHGLFGILSGKVDQLMILKFFNKNEAGVYSFGIYMGNMLYVLYNSCNLAIVPYYFKNYLKKQGYIKRAMKEYIHLFTFVAIIMIYLLPEIINIFGGIEYRKALFFSPISVLGFYFNFLYTFPSNYQFYRKETKYIAMGTIVFLLFNIVFNFLITPRYGLVGGAISFALGTLCSFLWNLYVSKYVIKNYEMNFNDFLIPIIVVFFLMLFFYIISDLKYLRYSFIILFSIIFYKLKFKSINYVIDILLLIFRRKNENDSNFKEN